MLMPSNMFLALLYIDHWLDQTCVKILRIKNCLRQKYNIIILIFFALLLPFYYSINKSNHELPILEEFVRKLYLNMMTQKS